MNDLSRKMLTASAVLLFGSLLYACGGGGSSIAGTGDITQAQFDKLLAASSAYVTLQSDTDTLKTNQVADETKIAAIQLIGHVPDSASAKTARTDRVTNAVVDNTDYGICPDMGQFVGHGFNDAGGISTDIFKQCQTNVGSSKYVINSTTGAVAHAPVTWYTGLNCTGTAVQYQDDGGYDRPTLQGGLVFRSGFDNKVLWIKPMDPNSTPGSITTHSNSALANGLGSCFNGDETHVGYEAVANVTDGNDGSGVPDAGVPNTYIYN